jgi:CheY-like chemotaxis protein
MGSARVIRHACLSHFYSDEEQRNRTAEYQVNLNVMAMSVVWGERQTTDGETYQRMNGGHSLSGKKALVVEDHSECAELLKMILENEGCDVRCAGTGAAALQVLGTDGDGRASDFNPDLVLLDLGLPDMSGVDVVEELRRRQLTVPPLVMLSAAAPGALYLAAKRVGVIGIRKPFDFVSLFSAISVAQYSTKSLCAPI